jgi:hypothetical protein
MLTGDHPGPFAVAVFPAQAISLGLNEHPILLV